MWFKNLRLYRFTSPFTHTAESLEDLLSARSFVPCASQEPMKMGWVPPAGDGAEQYVHSAQGFSMVCVKKQEKVLPAAVVNEALAEKVAVLSAKEGRSIGRKERTQLKDDVLMELLPKAFVRSSLHYAYIAPKDGYIVIDAASATKAEALLSLLRETIGSLPVVPVSVKQLPWQVMSRWVANGIDSKEFTLGGECELADPKDSGSVIRCKQQDLAAPEIKSHLDSGMIVTRLSLQALQGIDFVLDETLAIKRLKFADDIYEKAQSYEGQTALETFDHEFAVMTLELSALIRRLLEVFGGVNNEIESVDEIVARVEKTDVHTAVDEVAF